MDYEAEISTLKKQIDIMNNRIKYLEKKLDSGKRIHFNDRLLYHRHKNGSTIKDLAKYYGCSESTIKRHLADFKKKEGKTND